MTRNLIASLAVAALLAGCRGGVSYTLLVTPPRALLPRPPASVETLVVTPPARPHTNIGFFLGTEGWGDKRGIADVITRVRTAAAQRGCDGIIIVSIDRRWGKEVRPSVQASCFVYTAPARATPD